MPDGQLKTCLACGHLVDPDVKKCPACSCAYFRSVSGPGESQLEGPPRVQISDWAAMINSDIAAAQARSDALISQETLAKESASEFTESTPQSWATQRRLLRLVLLVVLGVAMICIALAYLEIERRDSAHASTLAACQGLFASISDGSFADARDGLEQVLHEMRPDQQVVLVETIHAEVNSLVARAKALEASDFSLAGETYRQAAYGCLLAAAVVPAEAERAGDGFVAAADLFVEAQRFELAAVAYVEAAEAYEAALDAFVGDIGTRVSRIREKRKTAIQDAALAGARNGESGG